MKKNDVLCLDIRKTILSMSYAAQSAHTGGALSVVEILVALYFHILHIDPSRPKDPNRDRLIFSKAHDAKALYAVLCERGFFPKSELEGYEKNNGKLPGHSTRDCVPGVEVSAGSLGHGLPMAVGIALALQKDNNAATVYSICSDGECDEGTTWESSLFAAHHELDNLIVIIDYNGLQGYGYTNEVINLEPLTEKWRAFGWNVYSVNGNSVPDIVRLLRTMRKNNKKPSVILAKTIKGFGGIAQHVNQISSQYKPPTEEEYKNWINTHI